MKHPVASAELIDFLSTTLHNLELASGQSDLEGQAALENLRRHLHPDLPSTLEVTEEQLAQMLERMEAQMGELESALASADFQTTNLLAASLDVWTSGASSQDIETPYHDPQPPAVSEPKRSLEDGLKAAPVSEDAASPDPASHNQEAVSDMVGQQQPQQPCDQAVSDKLG
ncbi:hypothetical protein V8C86DRAFT_2450545 [Haematococcus lacustris]